MIDLVDEGKIALTPAEKSAYLKEEEQRDLAELIQDHEATPSLSQAVKPKEKSAMHRLRQTSFKKRTFVGRQRCAFCCERATNGCISGGKNDQK